MKYSIYFTAFFFTIFSSNYSQSSHRQGELKHIEKSYFIENKGQWQEEVKYLARLNGLNVWITVFGIVYYYYKIVNDAITMKELVENENKEKAVLSGIREEFINSKINGHVIRFAYRGIKNLKKNHFKGIN